MNVDTDKESRYFEEYNPEALNKLIQKTTSGYKLPEKEQTKELTFNIDCHWRFRKRS